MGRSSVFWNACIVFKPKGFGDRLRHGTSCLSRCSCRFVIFGIDISPKTVERAKKYLSFPNVTLICGDFLNYPFDTVFDLIYSSLTFMHIKEKRQAIEKIYSLLSPSGRFVLSIDKNQSDILDYGKRSLKLYPDDPKKIHSILFSAGFSNIQTRETEFAYLFSAEKK